MKTSVNDNEPCARIGGWVADSGGWERMPHFDGGLPNETGAAVALDAKPGAIFCDEPLEVVEGQSEARPAASAMFLLLREIAAAIK